MNPVTCVHQVHSFPPHSPTEHKRKEALLLINSTRPVTSPVTWAGRTGATPPSILCELPSPFPIRCLSSAPAVPAPAPLKQFSYHSDSSSCPPSCPLGPVPDHQQSPAGTPHHPHRDAQRGTASLKVSAGCGQRYKTVLVKVLISGPCSGAMESESVGERELVKPRNLHF